MKVIKSQLIKILSVDVIREVKLDCTWHMAQIYIHPPLLWGPWRTGLGGSERVRLWPPGGGGGALFLDRVELPLVHGWEPSGREVGGPVAGAGKKKTTTRGSKNLSLCYVHLTLRYFKYSFLFGSMIDFGMHRAKHGCKDMYPGCSDYDGTAR